MNKLLNRIVPLIAALAFLQSCDKLYKEDMENCYEGVSVTLRVDPSMTDAARAEAAASHAVIYVFDSAGTFLERRETEIGKTELLWYPDAGELSVVGWINKRDTYGITEFGETVTRTDGLVSLLVDEASRAENGYTIPTDLFYGEAPLVNAHMAFEVEHKEILASRRTGQMTVTVRSLKPWAAREDGFYIVTGPSARTVDFFGNPGFWEINHQPLADFDANDEFVTGSFNLIPTRAGEKLTVQIWHDEDGLLYETEVATDGSSIDIVADRTENVLIDFTMGLDVQIEQTRWGVIHSWKVFN